MSVDGLNDDQYVKEGRVYLVRDDTVYPNRLKKFSEKFFTPLTGRAYPLEPGDQGLSYFFPDTGIQFLTLNSAWQIDHLHRNRASAHPTAVSRAMYAARQQLSEAIDGKELKAEDNVLKLAVWHHAVAAHEMMRNVNFLTNLKKHGVQLCLHGDVHEMRSDLLGYKSGNEISVVGAGSFGSPPEGRPESTPRLYNLLEIQRDHSTVRVNTRARPNANGAWQGWYEWPDPEGKGRLPYFDIDL
jgi:diadenosine tetraphosphatase ApaH/serine/threonine PP2A family protein phosphatase